MKLDHKPGEQMMIDYAGDKLEYVEADSGELINCEVLVCSLPFSGMIYVEALRSQKQEEFIKGIGNALEYFGGVPMSIKCDNLRSAIIKANRYEPEITEAMELLGIHYSTTILAARVRKPRDKAHVERSVNITYQRIYAPLRDDPSFSIKELNSKIKGQLELLNLKKISNDIRSRKEVFEQEEKAYLKILPTTSYKIQHITHGKVQLNYHVILGADYHQYSVPYTLIGKRLKLIYTSEHVEIFHELERVAIHRRGYKRNGYTTLENHMPPAHQAMHQYKGCDKTYFLNKAKEIGNSTYAVVDHILKSRAFVQQSFSSCLGILRLVHKHDPIRVENACTIALKMTKITYTTVQKILNNKMDIRSRHEPNTSIQTLFDHENIRGAAYYN